MDKHIKFITKKGTDIYCFNIAGCPLERKIESCIQYINDEDNDVIMIDLQNESLCKALAKNGHERLINMVTHEIYSVVTDKIGIKICI
jgi:hypothetical protein